MFLIKKKYATVKKDGSLEIGGKQRWPCKQLAAGMLHLFPGLILDG